MVELDVKCLPQAYISKSWPPAGSVVFEGCKDFKEWSPDGRSRSWGQVFERFSSLTIFCLLASHSPGGEKLSDTGAHHHNVLHKHTGPQGQGLTSLKL